MKREITLHKLQEFIKSKDFNPELRQAYFMKLIEEVGELSEVVRKDVRLAQTGNIKGTIEEELYDVLYYTLALANVYGIDIEECFYLKEELNSKKYNYKISLTDI